MSGQRRPTSGRQSKAKREVINAKRRLRAAAVCPQDEKGTDCEAMNAITGRHVAATHSREQEGDEVRSYKGNRQHCVAAMHLREQERQVQGGKPGFPSLAYTPPAKRVVPLV